ncbi:FAD-binding domain-containing protein [uncultured Algimonas sp.]|uniref:FAD-binding domain-containing protein n=1 Tax=uncultured Algimonas sp. TaxID=1547920 RepID=UPI00260D6193|nr:FAD-binding domain-containing protein [uncultured Algimonas sp.]
MAKPAIHIVWFKRDLRTHDHAPLLAGSEGGAVIPLYVAEPDYWQLPDTSARQWDFIRESLHELDARLTALGVPLIVRTGSVTDILSDLASRYEIQSLHSHEETGNDWTYSRDLAVKEWCADHSVPWQEQKQFGVFRPLKDRDGWSKRWDALMRVPQYPEPERLTPVSGLASKDLPTWRDMKMRADPCPGRQPGGRKPALDLLDGFLNARGRRYRTAMSSPVTAFDECSRLSPYLAYGCLSMREAAQALWKRQRDLKAAAKAGADDDALARIKQWRGSMQSFSGRLHWHCHFTQKLESEPGMEFRNLHSGYDGLRPDPGQNNLANDRLWAWSEGRMGLPFADACMRALNATGYLNFRMRAMLMCLSSYHLWLHWREPGLAYARKFTDYEPGIHWPQVQMQSGTTGMNAIRIYNPVKQGYDHDPDGRFVRHWVPELESVPDEYIQEPWKWDEADTVIPRLYPERIVDHMEAARHARDRIRLLKRRPGFAERTEAIYEKHGSRRRSSRRRKSRAV